MRRKRIGGGIALLLVAGVLTVLWWDTVIDLTARQRAYERIQPGMTLTQVEWVMGGPGDVLRTFRPIDRCRRSWEDAYTTVYVTFNAKPVEAGRVESVDRVPKASPDLGWLWFRRVALLLLAAQGIRLVRCSLRTPKPIRATLAPANDDPVGSWANS